MGNEKILAPDLELIENDEFYLFYEMMLQSLKTENVREGINRSLMLLRLFLESGSIALYMKNQNGSYLIKDSDSKMNDLSSQVGCIINKVGTIAEQKRILKLDLNFSDILKNITLLHIKVETTDCIVAIVNNSTKDLEQLFWDRLCDTMHIILKRAASYEKNTKAITMDILTGVDNRNSYEKKMRELRDNDDSLVLGIFDLFRLKYVNDNYSHDKGDIYIKKIANILKKYWPKEKTIMNVDGTENIVATGHHLYRYGGDEFVLLTSTEELSVTSIKADLAAKEAESISLGVRGNLQVGLNYGIKYHNKGDIIKDTFESADELMQEDKKKMYKKYNLDRRR